MSFDPEESDFTDSFLGGVLLAIGLGVGSSLLGGFIAGVGFDTTVLVVIGLFFVMFSGILQWLWVLPLTWRLRQTRRPATASGLLRGAFGLFAVNCGLLAISVLLLGSMLLWLPLNDIVNYFILALGYLLP